MGKQKLNVFPLLYRIEVQEMSVVYKIDVLSALKEKGYSTYKLRKEKLLGESVIQQLRSGDIISWSNIERLCELLECQIGDIVEYRKD